MDLDIYQMDCKLDEGVKNKFIKMVTEKFREKTKFLTFASGILVCYSLYAVLHETIFKKKYGVEEEKFTFAVAFTAVQTIVFTIVSKCE